MSQPAPAAPETRPAPAPPGPVRQILALPSFRNYWIAQFLSQLVGGTLRFNFIWLGLALTDWPAVAGVIALAAGLPALVLALPAGVWSDRSDRRALVIGGTLASALVVGVAGALTAAGWITLPLTVALTALAGMALAVFTPAQQAMVPMLVPRERLMNGVALQNLGMQVAMFLGALLGGGSIELLGLGGAFLLLAGLQLASAAMMLRVHLPPVERADAPPTGPLADMRAGFTFGLRREPLRSLLLLTVLISGSFGVMQINLPEVAKEGLGRGAFAASALLAGFAPGMLISSALLASRRELRRQGLWLALAISGGLGTGQVAVGLSESYALSLVIMFLWGLCGGVAMTTQRALMQSLTPDALMGRVMGIYTLAMLGAFPLSALFSALAAPRLGGAGAMVLMGALTMAAAPLIVWRRPIRTA